MTSEHFLTHTLLTLFPVLKKVDQYGHSPVFAAPSWVPDYEYRRHEGSRLRIPREILDISRLDEEFEDIIDETITAPTGNIGVLAPAEHGLSRQSAAENVVSTVEFTLNGQCLTLPAIHVGNCNSISTSFTHDPHQTEMLTAMALHHWRQLGLHYEQCIQDLDIQEYEMTSFTNAMCGTVFRGERQPDDVIDGMGTMFRDPEIVQTVENANNLIYNLQSLNLMHHRRVIFEFLPNRAMSRTFEHVFDPRIRHFGLGSDEMQVGDEIFIARGEEIPLICRPCDGGYRFVGYAWVPALPLWEQLLETSKAQGGDIEERMIDLV
ncbi:hypothetical protein VTL71DRAFT_1454 [Oculimacula yallundae]|uniref:Uncharacterized protein n=1 Tax=Oculimacula yallundae TaxID=86028 RepID=A0ABR4CB74_9HELO